LRQLRDGFGLIAGWLVVRNQFKWSIWLTINQNFSPLQTVDGCYLNKIGTSLSHERLFV
jgi:hypothetical protein